VNAVVDDLLQVIPPVPSASTGPRTARGKERSALNATKHGLAGVHLLLPGESETTYSVRMEAAFSALLPKSDIEAQVVALIGDDLWKLERLGKIEQGITLGRIEELLAQTETGQTSARITNALAVLGAALSAWERSPNPKERTPEFLSLFRLVSDGIDLVRATVPGISADALAACDDGLAVLWGRTPSAPVSAESYNAAFIAVRVLMAELIEIGDRESAAEDEMRKAVATVAVPDEKELKKIARYRAMLETSLQRRMAALEQLRSLAPAQAPANEDKERAREYRVKLRLVG